MQRTLLLYRHAKSSWEDWSLDDFDRPLSQRGQETAPLMGDFIKNSDSMPDQILCSPSLRTRQTLQLSKINDLAEDMIVFPAKLFHASAITLLNHIQNADHNSKCLCIIAHNPGIHDLAHYLAQNSAASSDRKKLRKKFPTAGLAAFHVETTHWKDISPELCQLQYFMTPKFYKKQHAKVP